MQAAAYLGDLGGLSATHQLILHDLRGTGSSDIPHSSATYRGESLVGDVEALRQHLELDSVDVLGHSASTNLALRYAIRHPDRIRRLVLVTPSLTVSGIPVDPGVREEIAGQRHGEAWFPTAFAALQRLLAGSGSKEDVEGIAPFAYGRWDHVTREHHALRDAQLNHEAAAVYAAADAEDAALLRQRLAAIARPVLLLAGGLDLNSPASAVGEFAGLFGESSLVVHPRAAHFPWMDDPAEFTKAINGFLQVEAGDEQSVPAGAAATSIRADGE